MNNSRLRKKGIAVVLLILVFLFLSTSVFWKWMFPVKYIEEIFIHAEQNEIDPYLVMAIIRVESKFVPDRTSNKGAIGLMQIMPETAKWAATSAGIPYRTSEDLVMPLINLQLGAWYLGYLNKRFNGNTLAIIASYNAGQNKVAGWLNDGTWDGSVDGIDGIPYGETRHYLQKVIFYHERYSKIYK